MVNSKEVPKLGYYCINALPKLITDHVRYIAHKSSAMSWYGLFQGDLSLTRDLVLSKQVNFFKQYIYENVLWYDYQPVFRAILKGVDDAITQTRKGWKPSTDMTQYRQEMEAISAFTEVVVFPMLRKLSFIYVPNSLRSRIIERLNKFENLRILIVNSTKNYGQWLFKSESKKFSEGLKHLKKLETFSCKYYCSLDIIKSLAEGSSDCLRVLDIENSKLIDDQSYPYIVTLTNIEELNIFNTKLSDESLGRIITNLPKLVHLIKPDFLCDALGWIDYLEEVSDPKFLIQEFFPSQQYFFHEEWQMEMVCRMCPFISHMFFIFHETCVPNYLVLANFEHLSELCLFGGSFYQDRIYDLMEIRGSSLKKLDFISIKGINYQALSDITICCPNLISLSLNNCDLEEFVANGDPNSDSEYERRQSYINMVKTAFQNVKIMENMEEISIQSRCQSTYLKFLINQCPNVRTINLCKNAEINDETLWKIYSQIGLANLQEFHCEHNKQLTMRSVHLLIEQCPHLKSISDIQSWSGITPTQVGSFRQMIHERNIDLDTRSYQGIRKYLEMTGSERRSYINTIAGPTIERIRLARIEREQQMANL